MPTESVTVTIETADASDEIDVPTALIDLLADGDESAATVVGDVAMLGIAQQAHGAVHHGQGEVDDEVAAAESRAMDRFEERFGRSFAEMTGHDH
jgi:outer membrane translocation and assembly module TamA